MSSRLDYHKKKMFLFIQI